MVEFEVLLRTTSALSLDWRMVEHHPIRVETQQRLASTNRSRGGTIHRDATKTCTIMSP